jgi:N-acetylmuramic acid 6-phosphate etherase
MGTEQISPRYRDIDAWQPGEILDALVEGQMAAVAAVRAASPAIEAATLAMVARLKRGGRIVYAGAGTSGRIAVQDGAELPPTFDWPRDRLVLLMAGGEAALLRSVENAEDDRAAGADAVRSNRIGVDDTVIGLAASGGTPYTIAVLEAARAAGALTIGIANNPDTPLLAASECPILLDTGPEAIAGSTRMKAGTAQKIALNLISTLAMIRLGRVFDGLMVDMVAMNEKLRRRSVAMLKRLTDADEAAIRAALVAADGKVKLARLILAGLDRTAADALMARHDGQLRPALADVAGA